MHLSEFYTNFIKALNKFKVEYLVVGGQAVNFHGYTRATLDLDIWIGKTQNNLENLKKTFIFLGYNQTKAREAVEYYAKNHKVNIPKDKNLIEILDDSILKTNFYQVYKKKVQGHIGDTTFFVIDLQSLLKIKTSSNRLIDLNDAEKLKQINNGNELSDSEEEYTLE